MTRSGVVWAAGAVAFGLALVAAVGVARALPLGYDSQAYWLAGRGLAAGERLYPAADAPLGAAGEFHYLPIVALPFVPLALLPLDLFVLVWLAVQLALAVAIGVALIRPLPHAARPWAAAAYAFFLPSVLEITLGNLNLVTLAAALLAWRWRERPLRAAAPLAAAVGVKLLAGTLLPFHLAAGRRRLVAYAFAAGVAALAVTAPLLATATRDYLALAPRYADITWVRDLVGREQPAALVPVLWSRAFSYGLMALALGVSILAGLRAARDRAHESDWHAIALAVGPFLLPFGFVWTTFLVMSLPLFAAALARALALAGAPRAAAVGGIAASWLALQAVQVRDLVPLALHVSGVLALVAITLALIASDRRQTLGRSIPERRATSAASG